MASITRVPCPSQSLLSQPTSSPPRQASVDATSLQRGPAVRTQGARAPVKNAVTLTPPGRSTKYSLWNAIKVTLGAGFVLNAARSVSVQAAAIGSRSTLIGRDASSASPCPRYAAGTVVQDPVSISSNQGLLQMNMSFQYSVDDNGFSKFCFVDLNDNVGPLLRVNPGDEIVIQLTNMLPPAAITNATSPTGYTPMDIGMTKMICGNSSVDTSSVNVHYHGMTIAPTCRADDVLHTVINSGENFTYAFEVPAYTSPGLYWYHPHIHGISEAAVLGGGSGPIIVEGLSNQQTAIGGLPERVFVLRDTSLPEAVEDAPDAPAWDISINYVPIPYPAYTPSIIQMKPNEKQFWRVVNAGADTTMNIQVVYDGTPQNLSVVALDGYPTRNGGDDAALVNMTEILIPPAGRAEFIVQGPGASVQNATFQTLSIDTGPYGDNDPTRPLAMIQVSETAPAPNVTTPAAPSVQSALSTSNLLHLKPDRTRTLAFSEVLTDPSDPDSNTLFYITVDGQTPQLFSMDSPPSVTTTQGSVEDWIVENQAQENHWFHQHQIHFALLERDGKALPSAQQQDLDTVQVPYWPGNGSYPSVKLRMDFTGADVGEYVYHCHNLGHEDNGMMAVIQVTAPATSSASLSRGMGSQGALVGVVIGATAALTGSWLF